MTASEDSAKGDVPNKSAEDEIRQLSWKRWFGVSARGWTWQCVSEKEDHAMWGKRLLRVLSIVYIVEGIAILLAPDSMINFTRWFADNPRNMRFGGILAIAAGILLAVSQNQQEQPPQP